MALSLTRRAPVPTRAAVIAALLSAGLAVSIISRIPGAERLGIWQTLSVVIPCGIGLWFVLVAVARRLLEWLATLGRHARWWSVALALACGAIWLYALPVGPAPASMVDVTVSVLDGKNAQAQGREVWLRLERDGVDVPLQELRRTGDWLDKSPFLLAANPQGRAAVQWQGSYTENLRLVFTSHAWSGRARVAWNGKRRDLDLYSAHGATASIDLGGVVTNRYLAFPERTGRQWLTAACDALALGALTLFAFVLFATRRASEDDLVPCGEPTNLLRQTVQFSIPMAVTSTFALLIFFPGLMTSDSLDQWHQAGIFSFNDAHPVLYGLFIGALRLAWNSPASVAFVQLLLFAASCGWLVSSVQRVTGAPTRLAWAASCLVALYPLLPLTAVTLWKDVPYAAAVIALTAFLMGTLPRRAARISVPATLGLCLTMFCAMSLRHNGPPVALAAALALFLIARRSRIRIMLALVGACVLMVLLKGPFSNAIGVEKAQVSYIVYSHHLAAHLAAGHLPHLPQDTALLRRLNGSQADWAYSCATVNPVIFNTDFDTQQAAAHIKDLQRIWLELAARRPDIEYAHGLCSSALIWRVLDSERDPLYLSGVGLWAPKGKVVWITGESGNVVPDSRSPELAEFVGHMVLQPGMQAAFRPAFFMYALIFACGVGMFRRNDKTLALLLVLPAVHTAFLAISIVAQDARYQLPLYAIALIAVPMLLGARRLPTRSDDESTTT